MTLTARITGGVSKDKRQIPFECFLVWKYFCARYGLACYTADGHWNLYCLFVRFSFDGPFLDFRLQAGIAEEEIFWNCPLSCCASLRSSWRGATMPSDSFLNIFERVIK